MRGQSLVELAFTAPILFMMIVSTAEIGYLANNYLILLDAVREGGRYATTLSPLNWNELDTRNYYRTACFTTSGRFNVQAGTTPAVITTHPSGLAGYTLYGNADPTKGFFDGAMCQTAAAMDPLDFNVNDDDIVVSAVAFINACSGAISGCYYVDGAGTVHMDRPIGAHHITITGRWPIKNRYCPGPGEDQRDPFNTTGSATFYNQHPELFPLPTDIRGFIVTGQQRSNLDNTSTCRGSKFHVGGNDEFDLEWRFNQLGYQTGDTSVSDRVPNGGMVIVELTWKHHQLFHFPPLNLLGDPKLYIWMMFPVSAAEPTATVGSGGP